MRKKPAKTRGSGGPPLPDFRRAAWQRLEAAEFLIGSEAYALDAVYLAGYAVECAIKAIIINRTPKKQRPALAESFRGSIAHNFEYLKALLSKRKCRIPPDVIEGMRPIMWWSTDLRYQVGKVDYNEATAALKAAKCVLEWMERSL